MTEINGITVKATVTGKRQITIPKEICSMKNISTGDQIVFKEEDGKIFIERETMNEIMFSLDDYCLKGFINENELDLLKTHIAEGSHFIICGHLGCGKTTLLRALTREKNNKDFDQDKLYILPEAYNPTDISEVQELIENNKGIVFTTLITLADLELNESGYERNIVIIHLNSRKDRTIKEISVIAKK